ncbi:hypothetical protein QQP08_027666 [Theobroma cacao]|nr:hypothetical protein QQP08_027666 [Theobroma cacao]
MATSFEHPGLKVVVAGSEREAAAAMVGFVGGFAVAAPLKAATVIQLGIVIVETTAAAAAVAVAAIFVTVVIEAVDLRGPAVTIAESVAAAVSSGIGFAATIAVVTAATVFVAAATVSVVAATVSVAAASVIQELENSITWKDHQC